MQKHQPSSTAKFVANGLWYVSNHPKLSVEVPVRMAEANRAMVSAINRGILSTQHPLGRALLRVRASVMQTCSIPGFYLHFVVRKRCIESLVRDAIEKGAEQLVVIGAGFDTLSLRISSDFPEMTVIEIDHPATQQWKRDAIAGLNRSFENIHLLPLDLVKETMKDLLLKSGCYQPAKTSAFVAEGLLMYLTEKEVLEILEFIRDHSGSNSPFVFSYMEEKAAEDYQFKNASGFVNLWLKLKKERFTWGLENERLAPFLRSLGFTLEELETTDDLREKYISDENKNAPLAVGENIASATTD